MNTFVHWFRATRPVISNNSSRFCFDSNLTISSILNSIGHFEKILRLGNTSWITTKNNNSSFPRVSVFGEMGKTSGAYYAVARGRTTGVYSNWDDCKAQVHGFVNARYKKFSTNAEAESFIAANGKPVPVSGTKPSSGVLGGSNSMFTTTTLATKRCGEGTIFTNPLPRPSAFSSGGSASGSVSGTAKPFTTSTVLNKRGRAAVSEDVITGKKRAKLSTDSNSEIHLSEFDLDEEGYVLVYTDGACKGNGKGKNARAGIGIWFQDNHRLNISEPVIGRQTNNTAEIQAAERAILQAKRAGINKLTLKTDSQFTINCATKWMNKWKRNGWKLGNKGDVKNREDLEKLDKAMNGIEIKWSYVKAHSGFKGNEEADRLAVEGSLKTRMSTI